MGDSGERRRDEHGDLGDRGTWFAKQLGEDWAEVEPGIYRFSPLAKKEAGVSLAPSDEHSAEEEAQPEVRDPSRPHISEKLAAMFAGVDEVVKHWRG